MHFIPCRHTIFKLVKILLFMIMLIQRYNRDLSTHNIFIIPLFLNVDTCLYRDDNVDT